MTDTTKWPAAADVACAVLRLKTSRLCLTQPRVQAFHRILAGSTFEQEAQALGFSSGYLRDSFGQWQLIVSTTMRVSFEFSVRGVLIQPPTQLNHNPPAKCYLCSVAGEMLTLLGTPVQSVQPELAVDAVTPEPVKAIATRAPKPPRPEKTTNSKDMPAQRWTKAAPQSTLGPAKSWFEI